MRQQPDQISGQNHSTFSHPGAATSHSSVTGDPQDASVGVPACVRSGRHLLSDMWSVMSVVLREVVHYRHPVPTQIHKWVLHRAGLFCGVLQPFTKNHFFKKMIMIGQSVVSMAEMIDHVSIHPLHVATTMKTVGGKKSDRSVNRTRSSGNVAGMSSDAGN